MTTIKTLADVDEACNYAYLAGKADLLRELIKLWEPKEKEAPLLVGVLLDQLRVRLGLLEGKYKSVPQWD